MNDTDSQTWKRRLKFVVRLVILGLVIWGIWRAGDQAVQEWQRRTRELDERALAISEELQETPHQSTAASELQRELGRVQQEQASLKRIDWSWLTIAGAFYIVGLLPSWRFWHQCMVRMKQQPLASRSLWAYFLGHLGKYVPGKALVVILRSTAVASDTVRPSAAALAVFVETLTMIAVGGFVAAATLAAITQQFWLSLLSVGLACLAVVPLLPPVFQNIVRFVRRNALTDDLQVWIQCLDWRFLATGWITISLGWLCLGASLWATMRSLPVIEPLLDLPTTWLIATGCAALAMVGGFVSLLPGGLGVREWVVMAVLTPRFGPIAAFAAAGLLRLVWLVSELVVCGILYFFRRPREKQT